MALGGLATLLTLAAALGQVPGAPRLDRAPPRSAPASTRAAELTPATAGDEPGAARLPSYAAPTAPRPTPAAARPSPGHAAAAPGAIVPARLEPPARTWFGWQVLAADAAAGALLLGAAAGGNEELFLAAFAPLAIAGPMVHAAHGDGRGSLASLGLGLGSAVLGGVAGAAARCAGGACEGEMGALELVSGALVGALIGRGAASIVDAAFLSFEDEDEDEDDEADGVDVFAGVGPTAGGATLGLGGRF
jgi:hypothetical protein